MLNIGKLTSTSPDGHQELVGEIKTLDVDLKVRLVANDSPKGPNAPSHTIYAKGRSGEVQVGSAWEKTIRSGNRAGERFLSLTCDDPSFPAPLNVAAFQVDETVWEVTWRRRQDRRPANGENE